MFLDQHETFEVSVFPHVWLRLKNSSDRQGFEQLAQLGDAGKSVFYRGKGKFWDIIEMFLRHFCWDHCSEIVKLLYHSYISRYSWDPLEMFWDSNCVVFGVATSRRIVLKKKHWIMAWGSSAQTNETTKPVLPYSYHFDISFVCFFWDGIISLPCVFFAKLTNSWTSGVFPSMYSPTYVWPR